jgi:hypothetical protein
LLRLAKRRDLGAEVGPPRREPRDVGAHAGLLGAGRVEETLELTHAAVVVDHIGQDADIRIREEQAEHQVQAELVLQYSAPTIHVGDDPIDLGPFLPVAPRERRSATPAPRWPALR